MYLCQNNKCVVVPARFGPTHKVLAEHVQTKNLYLECFSGSVVKQVEQWVSPSVFEWVCGSTGRVGTRGCSLRDATPERDNPARDGSTARSARGSCDPAPPGSAPSWTNRIKASLVTTNESH